MHVSDPGTSLYSAEEYPHINDGTRFSPSEIRLSNESNSQHARDTNPVNRWDPNFRKSKIVQSKQCSWWENIVGEKRGMGYTGSSDPAKTADDRGPKLLRSHRFSVIG